VKLTPLAAVVLTAALVLPGARAEKEKKIGRLLVTYYWVIDESSVRYRGPRSVELRDTHGKLIARTSRWFRRDLRMEGSGRLRDGRVVTYVRELGGESRYRVTNSSYGDGIGKCPLIPYRTLAVDPRIIRLGSKVYIPELKGALLPDGTVHDGIFMANDKAPFRGMHIDIFTAVGPRSTKPFVRKGYRSRSHVVAYLLEGPDPRGCQAR
jgi:3D (Asp-Asp-Asp) domain-containing protein